MELTIFEKLKKRWNDNIEKRASELNEVLEPIITGFNNSGIRFSVWHSLGSKQVTPGISTEGFLGYSEKDGRWGLMIKTIERDHKTNTILNSAVRKLNGKSIFIKEAVNIIPELLNNLNKAIEQHKKELIEAKNIASNLID
jgi:hypothetical protein